MKSNNPHGFTYVEVVTVIALMVVLAVVAWGRFSKSYELAFKATMIYDLKNLATAQELYYRLHFDYASSVSNLNFSPSSESIITITEATPTGWAGWNQMPSMDTQCELYVGNAVSPLGFSPTSERVGCGSS